MDVRVNKTLWAWSLPIALLALMYIIGVLFPRFYAYLPGAVGIFGVLALWLSAKIKPQLNLNTLIIPAALWLLALLSLAWARDFDVSFDRVQKLLLVFIPGVFLLSFFITVPTKKIKPWLWLIPAAIFMACALMILDISLNRELFNFSRDLPDNDKYTDAVYNRGCVAIVLSVFPAYYFLKLKTNKSLLHILFMTTIILMLLYVESQSAQLALILAMLIYFFFPYERPKAWTALIVFISILVFCAPLIAIYVYKNFASVLDTLPFLGFGGGYAGGRTEIWSFVAKRALESPLYGFGIEATKAIKNFDTPMIYHFSKEVLHPHNFVLQFWIEFGIIGAAVACTLLGFIITLIQKLEPQAQRIALPTFIASLCVAATAYGFWQGWWIGLLFMIAGLVVLCERLIKTGTH